MSRVASHKAGSTALCFLETSTSVPILAAAASQRAIGNFGVPEFFGKPSPYTEGTKFLGTPTNHQDLLKKRPVSPDVFAIDKPAFHYKMPLGATTSILNRVTGVAMYGGFAAAGGLALLGDLPAAITAFKAAYPLLVFPAKFAVAFPLLFHYLGGLRHIAWDHSTIGNQSDHKSLLETPTVELHSKYLLYGAAGLSAVISVL